MVPPEGSVTGEATLRGRPNGEENAEMFTVPEKLLMLVKVITDVPVVPCGRERKLGLAEMVKSSGGLVTWTDTTAEWNSEPLIPVTVTI